MKKEVAVLSIATVIAFSGVALATPQPTTEKVAVGVCEFSAKNTVTGLAKCL